MTEIEKVAIDILTEDGKIVHVGDRVYNYYDMKPGVIQPLSDYDTRQFLEEPHNARRDIWFYVKPDDGSQRALLNGERICTVEFARRRGFRDA